MSLIAQIGVFFLTFFIMEFMAWFSHKYVMHGFLWSLHKDHHHKDHNSWFERNDLFFIFYAVVSMGCVILWGEYGFTPGLAIGIGIFALTCYFAIYEVTLIYVSTFKSIFALTCAFAIYPVFPVKAYETI